jgi:hypothetical protein
MGQRRDREFDDYNFDDKRAKRAGKKHQGMKIINKFVEEDIDDDFFDDVDDDSVKKTQPKPRKY